MSVIFGARPVLIALTAGRRKVREVWIAEGREREVTELTEAAVRAGASVRRVSRLELDRRSSGGVHQGVVAQADALPALRSKDAFASLTADSLVIALDGIQDPQNLGAILRSASCAGAAFLVVPKDRAAGLTPAAVKVAEGAAEFVPVVVVTNLGRALGEMKECGLWVYGFDQEGEKVADEVDLSRGSVLVFGGEGAGIRRLVREACDRLIRIPTAGPVGSLNVSNAAAVGMFEAVRQRRARRLLAPAPGLC